MKAIVGLVAVVVVLYAGLATALVPTFTLTEVTTYEQVVACGKSGGRGALVYELDEFGSAEDDGASFCVKLVK